MRESKETRAWEREEGVNVLDGAGVVVVALGFCTPDHFFPLLLGWPDDGKETDKKICMGLVIPDSGIASLFSTGHFRIGRGVEVQKS